MNYKNLEFDKIEKSKNLYFNTGSLRRYTLRPEIANSWIRYNLFKNKNVKYIGKNDSKNRNVKIYLKKIENKIEEMGYKIYLIMDDQNVINSIYEGNDKFHATGAEISNKTKLDFTVFKNEHISKVFYNKFTHGFIIKKEGKYFFTIGIEGKIENYSENKINTIRENIAKISIGDNEINRDYEFLDYKNICNGLNYNRPIFLIGESGVGKYSFVKYIWNEKYKDFIFNVINCSRVKNIEKYFNVRNKTLLYFEKLELLDFAEQLKLVKIIESKQVYNELDKPSNFNNVSVVLSTRNVSARQGESDLIKERLLTRLTVNSVKLKTMKEYEKNIIMELFDSNVNSIVSDTVLNFIGELNWKNNFHDLRKLIEMLNDKKADSIIELNDLPRMVIDESPKITTLKEAEKKMIKNSIVEFENNITLCAKSLFFFLYLALLIKISVKYG